MSDDAAILELEDIARLVLKRKREHRPRRPIVIEFCGSPKAGKSSCINSLVIFLKRNGFHTQVLTERASVCPVQDKFDPLFNMWTACSAIAELSEHLDGGAKSTDVIIADRAVFDALCWFTWQRKTGRLDDSNFSSLKAFLTMERLRAALDLVFVFSASPETSMDREYAHLLTRKTGSVMNHQVLSSYLAAIAETIDTFGSQFQRIEQFDTTNLAQNEVSYLVTKQILEALEHATDERIGYLPAEVLQPVAASTIFSWEAFSAMSPSMVFGPRSDVEATRGAVQPIPVLVITDRARSQVLVLEKKKNSTSGSSPERDRPLLYAGGHTRPEDHLNGVDDELLVVLQRALAREIKEELGIAVSVPERPEFCVWDSQSGSSRRHMAVCFVYEADMDNLKVRLDEFEFQGRSGKSRSGRVYQVSDLKGEDFEAWSAAIMERIFGVGVMRQSELPLGEGV